MITSAQLNRVPLPELARIHKLMVRDLAAVECEMWERVVQGQHNREKVEVGQIEYDLSIIL